MYMRTKGIEAERVMKNDSDCRLEPLNPRIAGILLIPIKSAAFLILFSKYFTSPSLLACYWGQYKGTNCQANLLALYYSV